MTWPIGASSLQFEIAPDGAIVANGVRVTANDGWINVPIPRVVAGRSNAVGVATLRLRLQRGPLGDALLTVQDITLGPKRFPDMEAVAQQLGEGWIAALGPAVHAEISRRVDAGTRAVTSCVPAATPEDGRERGPGEG